MTLKFRIQRVVEKFAALNVQFQFALLNLPNELIGLVIEHVDSAKALSKLCRTCRRLQRLAEPALYRYILFRTGAYAESVLHALQARPERCYGIWTLEVPCNAQYRQNFRAIAGLLNRTTNLRELLFESPQCNNGEFEDSEPWIFMAESLFGSFQAAAQLVAEDELARRPLQRLQKLTIHLNGCASPYWTLDDKSLAIFLHPSLQYLKMSCVNILDGVFDHSQEEATSPLKHLELEECNITHKGLHGILSFQKALEVLYLGENCNNIRHFPDDIDPTSNHLFSTSPRATLEALKQQQHSLRSLTYTTTETYYQHRQLARQMLLDRSPVDAGFADFDVLENVVLIGQCPDFERAVMTSRSPPNLTSLQFKAFSPFRRDIENTSAQDSALALVPFLRAPACSVPRTLKTIDVTYEPTASIQFEFELPESTKIFIQAAGNATESIGVRLSVFYRRYSRYFPPYLYGEPHPQEGLVFTGLGDGFVGRFAAYPDREEHETDFESEDESSLEHG